MPFSCIFLSYDHNSTPIVHPHLLLRNTLIVLTKLVQCPLTNYKYMILFLWLIISVLFMLFFTWFLTLLTFHSFVLYGKGVTIYHFTYNAVHIGIHIFYMCSKSTFWGGSKLHFYTNTYLRVYRCFNHLAFIKVRWISWAPALLSLF